MCKSINQTTHQIAERLNISKASFKNHLKLLGYTIKLDIWVPYEVKEMNLIQRINACDNLLKHEENGLFLKQTPMNCIEWLPEIK